MGRSGRCTMFSPKIFSVLPGADRDVLRCNCYLGMNSLRQNMADACGGLVDAQQRGKRRRNIYRLHTSVKNSRSEHGSVEAKRYMAVIGVGRKMCRSVAGSLHLIGVRNQHDIPSAVRRVTMGDEAAKFCERLSRLQGSHLQ